MKTKQLFRLAALCSAVAATTAGASTGKLTISDRNVCAGKDINEVIKRNAPIVYFHEKERYFPTSADKFIQDARLLDANGHTIAEYPADLHSLAGFENTYLSLKNTNPSDSMNDYKNSRYTGNAPVNLQINAPMYVTTYSSKDYPFDHTGKEQDYKEGHFVNINYSMFFAYSGPQTGEFFGDFYLPGIAEHQGDWEGITVKLNENCTAIVGYAYMNHGEPMWIKPGSIGTDLGDQRPRIYTSLFTHASYPQETRYKEKEYGLAGTSIRFGDLTQQESSSRITWDSANHLKHVHTGNVNQYKWANYKGRFGAKVSHSLSLGDRLWNGFKGVYSSSMSWQQKALLNIPGSLIIKIMSSYIGPVIDGISVADTSGPSTPWTQGTRFKLMVDNPKYWSDHHGQFNTYRGGYIDNKHVVKLPSTMHVVSHNGNMERYAGGSIDGSYVLVLDKGERVVSHQGNMRHYTSGHVDGRNVLHLRSGQRVVSHNGGMTRYAGGYVDQKHVVLLNRDEKVVSWQSGFQSYNGGYVDGKNVKIVKKAKVTRPAGWCTHPTSKMYEGDFDGDNTTDLLCKDNLRYWTVLSSGKTQFGETGWCTHPTAELFVEELNNDNNYDLLCEDANHTRWQLLSNGNGVAL